MNNREAVEVYSEISLVATTNYVKPLPWQSPHWKNRKRLSHAHHLLTIGSITQICEEWEEEDD